MIVRKFVIPVLAVAGMCLAAYTVMKQNRPVTPAQPVAEPAHSPYDTPVAGAGLVESANQNVAIGTNVAGVASKVYVVVGDRVKAGDPLFTIDDRAVRAELLSKQSALAIAERNLEKLRSMPRPEELPPAESRVEEMASLLADATSQLNFMENVADKRAVSQDDLSKRRYLVNVSKARLAQAEADLKLLKAGAWKPDLEIATSQVESARADVERVKTDLERLTVRAPKDGQVLQLNIRAGEFAQAGALTTPLMIFGDTSQLHIRVDVDENDAWRVKTGAPARASLRGNSSLSTPLTFVRVEPFVVPKKSLTGESNERVDTRVLQVIYSFDPKSVPVYVGQQMDVYIEGVARPDTTPTLSAAQASAAR